MINIIDSYNSIVELIVIVFYKKFIKGMCVYNHVNHVLIFCKI